MTAKKENTKMKRVGDFIPDHSGEELNNIENILDTEVQINGFELRTSAYEGNEHYAVMDIEGEAKAVSTGGAVVIKKLQQLEEQNAFPVLGTFVMPGRYYDLI